MNIKTLRQNYRRGQVVIFSVVILGVLSVLTGALLQNTRIDLVQTRYVFEKTQARALAEAGLEKAIYELNKDAAYSGETNAGLTGGVFVVSIATIDSSTKQITSTGYVPNAASPRAQITIKSKANIDSTVVAFNYGVQVGAGGFTLSNSATINGNVYSNGNITGANSAKINGDATIAGGIAQAADQLCTTLAGNLDLNLTASRLDSAQQFTPSVDGPLTKVSLYLKKTGNPADLSFALVTNGVDDLPTKTTLAIGSIPKASVTGVYGWIDGTFSATPILNAGTTYWLVVDSSGTASAYYSIGVSADGSCSPGNTAYSANAFASSPIWTFHTPDLNFKVFLGGLATMLDNMEVTGSVRAHTITDSDIGGDAYYTTINGSNVDGTSYPGTPDSTPSTFAISDAQIMDWEQQAEDGGIYSGTCPYNIPNNTTIGPKKIPCDVTITGSNVVYLAGPVWIVGNLTMSNSAKLVVSSALGDAGAVLIADNDADDTGSGKISTSNSVEINGNGNSHSNALLVSMNTSDLAINVGNSGTASIFFAPHGTLAINNSASFKEITAFHIIMGNSAVVNYTSGLQSSTFSNGPGASWQLMKGTYAEKP